MNGCSAVQAGFTDYLDDRLSGREMQEIAAHLRNCAECSREWDSLRSVQSSPSLLGPLPEPDDLLLRLRVSLSQERARQRRSRLEALGLAWKNTIGPFLLQASAGFVSAVLLMGTVIMMVGVFAKPESAQAVKDDPNYSASAPHLLYLSSAAGPDDIGGAATPVVVEAYVNGAGQVYDYRIVSGPTDPATRSQIENMLLFSVFEPAKFFGQPVRGLAVLSFSGIAVRG
jgi:anti-sigma factor RsiW